MRKTSSLLWLLWLLFLLISCEEELEVNADWEEIGIAYMILDKRDSVQYLKLNKAYLNYNSDARELAAIEDSLYFDDRDMQITIGIGKERDTMYRISMSGKEEGLFASPDYYVYRTPPGFTINEDRLYRIEIRNLKTGYEMRSETRIVRDGTIIDPFPNIQQLAFATCDLNDNFRFYLQRTMTIASGKDVKFYDLDINFYYREVDSTNNQDTLDRVVNWPVSRLLKTQTTLGGQEISKRIEKGGFYERIAQVVEPKEGVQRIAGNVEFVFTGAGQAMYDYINVNQPSLGIVQKRPEYSTFENGLGLFSSKTSQKLSMPLDRCSLEQLVDGEFTHELGFVR